jgi:hypothetical protein
MLQGIEVTGHVLFALVSVAPGIARLFSFDIQTDGIF